MQQTEYFQGRLIRWFITLCIAALTAPSALAHWQLNNQLSQLSFVTTKAGNIGETHQFKSMAGEISEEGEITLTIDVASVDTLIPIRDERMRKILFQMADFPQITFKGQIDASEMQSLNVGGSRLFDVKGKLTVRDQSINLTANVLATKVNGRAVLVNSVKPILLDAGSLGLAAAVEELREIAGLPSISLSVPVTFVLTFSG